MADCLIYFENMHHSRWEMHATLMFSFWLSRSSVSSDVVTLLGMMVLLCARKFWRSQASEHVISAAWVTRILQTVDGQTKHLRLDQLELSRFKWTPFRSTSKLTTAFPAIPTPQTNHKSSLQPLCDNTSNIITKKQAERTHWGSKEGLCTALGGTWKKEATAPT